MMPHLPLAVYVLISIASPLSAQTPTNNRFLFVNVTDPNHRFVVGLEQQHFEVVQNGASRPITSFSAVDEPMTIAVVSDSPLAGLNLNAGDKLIQTASATDAIRQLQASKNSRKALIVASTSGPEANLSIPGGILVVNANKVGVEKTLVELRNQYRIGFAADSGADDIQVMLSQPNGLPVLKPVCFLGCVTR